MVNWKIFSTNGAELIYRLLFEGQVCRLIRNLHPRGVLFECCLPSAREGGLTLFYEELGELAGLLTFI